VTPQGVGLSKKKKKHLFERIIPFEKAKKKEKQTTDLYSLDGEKCETSIEFIFCFESCCWNFLVITPCFSQRTDFEVLFFCPVFRKQHEQKDNGKRESKREWLSGIVQTFTSSHLFV
jgi:hypothetical protein